ncbi:MAG: hypothetical protein DPW14_15810, partial [Planctomycetes bacterium]|nr:hypothetical protein [Planctomycetota bacterium]
MGSHADNRHAHTGHTPGHTPGTGEPVAGHTPAHSPNTNAARVMPQESDYSYEALRAGRAAPWLSK